ncbi:MAG: pyruvate-formate lyase-activating enzyme [Gammaproteobacteria bacterium]|jgi:pyruvate-formate lyase-activating enzyme
MPSHFPLYWNLEYCDRHLLCSTIFFDRRVSGELSIFSAAFYMFEYAISTLRRGARTSYHSYTYTPTDAIIFLTYRCTSRCMGCNIWKRPVDIDEELTWEEWKPILENLAKNNIKNVEMFGGDTLLRKDLLLKMIQFCTDKGICTSLPTNSISLTVKTVQSLVDAGLGTIYLSLDEVPDIGQSIRAVKRHFDRVVKSIGAFKKFSSDSHGPRISCITTVSCMNYRFLERLMKVAYEAGADEYMIRGISEFTNESVESSAVNRILPSPYFMPTDNKTHAFSEDQATELLDILKYIWKERAQYQPMSIDMTNLKQVNAENLAQLTYPHQTCVLLPRRL